MLLPGALNSVQQAVIARRMAFRKLMKASIAATVLSGAVGVGMAYGVVLAGGIAGVLGAGALLVSRSVRRNAPGGWGAALSDLKAAVVIAQKGGVRG